MKNTLFPPEMNFKNVLFIYLFVHLFVYLFIYLFIFNKTFTECLKLVSCLNLYTSQIYSIFHIAREIVLSFLKMHLYFC